MHTADAKSAKAPRYAAVKPSSGESKAKIRPHPDHVQQEIRAKHVGALRSGEDVTNSDASGMSKAHHKGCTSALDHFIHLWTHCLPVLSQNDMGIVQQLTWVLSKADRSDI